MDVLDPADPCRLRFLADFIEQADGVLVDVFGASVGDRLGLVDRFPKAVGIDHLGVLERGDVLAGSAADLIGVGFNGRLP